VIEVVDYDPGWPSRFEQLRATYLTVMSAAGIPVLGVEHVGSTSVPGLAGKPVIDIDIVVAHEHVGAASAALVSLGFHPLGELGIAQRWAFRAPPELSPTNTYVIVAGSLALKNHLRLRDTLRSNVELRDEYAEVKRTAGTTAADMFEYGRAKNAVIQKILAVAGLSDAERRAIDSQQVPGPEVVR
jgi:GrpB-like predicted nucleotidyltransferase (UPF0157 family)